MPPNSQQLRQRPLLVTVLLLATLPLAKGRQPNVVFILADDAGWDDIESHDPSMATPNIKRLREDGMFLNQSYTLPRSVPARSALLTGSNTVIVLMSDNGGPVAYGSVNWPLRGVKKSLFEGGTRSYTVLRAPGLAKTNITWSGMVHAIDWLPTFVDIGGGTAPSYTHGQSHWEQILRNEAGLRTSFIYNVDEAKNFNHMAIRMNQWKLIGAVPGLSADKKWSAGFKAGWYPPYQLLDSGEATWENLRLKGFPKDYALFNIKQDPEERKNVAKKHPKIVEKMRDKLIRWVGNSANSPNVSYPLHPLPRGASMGIYAKDGIFVTCWCQPPGLAPCSKDEAGEK